MTIVDSDCTWLAVILIDFVLKKDENYYPQVFLKEYKYIEKEKKVTEHVADDLENPSDSDESDKEYIRGLHFCVKFFISHLSLNPIKPGGLPVIQNLQT